MNAEKAYRVTILVQNWRLWLALCNRARWGGVQGLAEVVDVAPAFRPGEHGDVLRLSRLLRVRHCYCVSGDSEQAGKAGARGMRGRNQTAAGRAAVDSYTLILRQARLFSCQCGWRGLSSDYSGSHGGWEAGWVLISQGRVEVWYGCITFSGESQYERCGWRLTMASHIAVQKRTH